MKHTLEVKCQCQNVNWLKYSSHTNWRNNKKVGAKTQGVNPLPLKNVDMHLFEARSNPFIRSSPWTNVNVQFSRRIEATKHDTVVLQKQ